MGEEPKQVTKRAIDITPHYHAIWCSIGDGEPFANAIVGRRWSEDGKRLSFMLDTHNFLFADPDEEVSVVEVEPQASEKIRQMWAESDEKATTRHPKPTPTRAELLALVERWEADADDRDRRSDEVSNEKTGYLLAQSAETTRKRARELAALLGGCDE